MLVSICIPSYNRPEELLRLLQSIDSTHKEKFEIVICEDNSPKRAQIKEAVAQFKSGSCYRVEYIENSENLGYDKNLRECILHAKGSWIIFMGDDDIFIPGVLDGYFTFLDNTNAGYVLRSYRALYANGQMEYFKYYKSTKFFEPGYASYLELFRKSVFISGVTFKKEYTLEYLTDWFDGSLLFQLYIVAEICMKHPSAYYEVPITQSFEGGTPYFGSSETEKDLYTPGTITIENSINFMKKFFVITEYMDGKYNLKSTEFVKKDMSKYSYPILSIQRNKGRKEFYQYHKRLTRLGISGTSYYYIYFCGLYIFGKKTCDSVIRFLKKILGKTPKL